MSTFVSGMDNAFGEGRKLGENAHVEYGWSKESPATLLTQFYYQLVRCGDDGKKDLAQKLRFMIQNLDIRSIHFNLLYKLSCETRDIKSKGERDLSYLQLVIWYEHYPQLAFQAFKLYCLSVNGAHPYGSWKDVKYMCEFIKNYYNLGCTNVLQNPFIIQILNFAVDSAKEQWEIFKETQEGADSLIFRWLPREKSKFSWMFAYMAKRFFPDYSLKKAKTHFRKVCSFMNKRLDTIQIKQCGKNWKNINHTKTTSITLRKQKNALLNVTKKGELRDVQANQHDQIDRMKCRENLLNHIADAKAKKNNAKLNGQRCNVGELVKDAITAKSSSRNVQDAINLQWEDNSKNNEGLGNIIACCDTSGSMQCDESIPLFNAIGMSIRVSEMCHPHFRNRILNFDAQPQWIILNENQTFCEKVYTIERSAWGMNTDVYKMFDMILHSIVVNEIPPHEVENLVLAIFSDMQFDSPYHNTKDMDSPAGDVIRRKFAVAGLNSKFKVPYKTPHLLFWNLRKTTGFPDKITSQNVSFISGYSSQLLNVFATKGISALQKLTPFDILVDILSNKRYNILDEKIGEAIGLN